MDEAAPLRATRILPAGSWPAESASDVLTLDYDDRFRRRRLYRGTRGTQVLLDLPEARLLRDGDGLALDAGGAVLVRAAPERLVEVTAPPALLLRLAWHLGNRHLPAEIGPTRILIRHDHVIEAMLAGLGATLAPVEAPFNPEGGAYGEHNRAAGHHHAHAHGEGHGHDHADHHHH
jgi:urease accessory protein